MKARDLAAPYPTVRLDTPATEAARVLTEHGRPGLLVVDEHDHPVAILPASQVLRLLIPSYVQEDPALARVVEESVADKMCEALEGRSVAQLLPKDRARVPLVQADDTMLEVAALMAAERSPLVAVVEGKGGTGSMVGAITAAALLTRLLPRRITGA